MKRRNFLTGLLTLISANGLRSSAQAETPPVDPKAPLDAAVPYRATRAPKMAPPSQPLEFVRFQRFSDQGPPADLVYQATPTEPVDDPTRIAFSESLWGRQVFPTGVVNARSFGAVGDGVTDDTTALQAFLHHVVRTGSKGFIPAGRYRTTQPLEIGDNSETRYRGFTIEGAGRTGIAGRGGTLILIDSAAVAEAVVIWRKNAWRDGRLTGIGVASRKMDGATYGVVIDSSEVSHLSIENCHVENVTTAFALLRGTGANGELCSWSFIQTWNVLNYFYSDAGQALGLRFNDSYCYYRPGGTLFRFATDIVGGGFRLINFDATVVVAGTVRPPAEMSGTTLLSLSALHNAPVTVIGGRFETITTLVRVESEAQGIVVNNLVQFLGCQFTTDLSLEGIRTGSSSVEVAGRALVQLTFIGCKFEAAFPKRLDSTFAVRGDVRGRGQVQFSQCAYSSYAQPPFYIGPVEALSAEWVDCIVNQPATTGSWKEQNYGGPFSRTAGYGSAGNASAAGGVPQNLLIKSGFIDAGAPGAPAAAAAAAAAAPWTHRGQKAFLSIGPIEKSNWVAGAERLRVAPDGLAFVLGGRSGVYQDVQLRPFRPSTEGGDVTTMLASYKMLIAFIRGNTTLRFSLSNSRTGQVYDEMTLLTRAPTDSPVLVHLSTAMAKPPDGSIRIAIDNVGDAPANVGMQWQMLSDRLDAVFVPTENAPVNDLWRWATAPDSVRINTRLQIPVRRMPASGGLAGAALGDLYADPDQGRLMFHDGNQWLQLPRTIAGLAPPETGTFAPGDECRNTAPGPGKPISWICVAGGSPGRWVSSGLL